MVIVTRKQEIPYIMESTDKGIDIGTVSLLKIEKDETEADNETTGKA